MILPSRIAAIALGTAFVLLPVAQLMPLDIDRAAGLLFLPGCWLALRIPTSGTSRSMRSMRALLIGWLLWALLGVSWSSHFAYALVGLSVFLLALGVGAAALRITKTGDESAGRILLGSLATASVVGMGLVFLRLHAPGGGPINVFSHLRLFGMHQGVGALAGAAWLMLSKSRREQMLAGTTALIAWTGVFWAGGRAPLLALATSAALWVLLGVTPRIRATAIWVACAVSGLFLSLPLPLPSGNMGWNRALTHTVEADSMSDITSLRTDLWLATALHISERPLLGYGPESYRFIRPKQGGEQPHNVLLQWSGDYGLVGATCLLSMLGISLWSGLFSASTFSRAAACLAAGLLVCSLVDGVAYHAVTLGAWLLLLGMALAGATAANTTNEQTSLEKKYAITLIALTGLAGLILVLHGRVFYKLRYGPIPLPHSTQTDLIRTFPSETIGLLRWLDAWQKGGYEQDALEWAIWAQPKTDMPTFFQVFAGNLYVKHNFFADAEDQYRAALSTTFFASRVTIQHLLDLALAAQGKTTPDTPEGDNHAETITQ